MTNHITEIVQRQLPTNGRSVVFVAGLGGVGKSEFCQYYMPGCSQSYANLQTDWYITCSSAERRKKIGEIFATHQEYDHNSYAYPRNWYDWDRFRHDLSILKTTGRLSLSKVWNQKTGEMDLDIEITVDEHAVIWCDGIYMLDPAVKDYADMIILLEVASQSARLRSEQRDQHRNSAEYFMQKNKLVEIYDTPYFNENKKHASIVIDNSDLSSPKILSMS